MMSTSECRELILADARDGGVTHWHLVVWLTGCTRAVAMSDLRLLQRRGLLDRVRRADGVMTFVPSSLCAHLPPVDQSALFRARAEAVAERGEY